MKISTKGRYALRLMLDLATEGNGKPVSIKDIAGRQDISEKYLEQIIILGHGALRVSARMFHEEVQNVEKQIRALVQGEA